jgi:hypothetical protein
MTTSLKLLPHRCHFTLFVCLLFAACKKDDNNYPFSGLVQRGNQGSSLADVSVSIQHQPVINGVFNSDYSTLTNTHTNADGQYTLAVEAADYASLRLLFMKQGYHKRTIDVDPAAIEQGNGYTQNVWLYPQSTIHLHITDGKSTYNQLLMRYKNVNFDCVCCDDEWKSFSQPLIDTTLSCMVYGDQFVHYQYRLINAQLDTLINDSIYCGAFENQTIELTY